MSSSFIQYFPSAAWPTALKLSSFLGGALLIGVGIAAAQAIPYGTHVPYAEAVGSIVAFVPPAIALFALFFIVAGYELKSQQLCIRRLLWTTRISLSGLQRIQSDPAMMKCSFKLFGNGGLFSITGLYQNRVLGRYRAFVTNPKQAVALFLPDRTIVVSPADTDAFVQAIRAQFPNAQVEPSNHCH